MVLGSPSRTAPTSGRLLPPLTAGHRCAVRHFERQGLLGRLASEGES
jgi:hypothetical protein